jgi:hypothetical protein
MRACPANVAFKMYSVWLEKFVPFIVTFWASCSKLATHRMALGSSAHPTSKSMPPLGKTFLKEATALHIEIDYQLTQCRRAHDCLAESCSFEAQICALLVCKCGLCEYLWVPEEENPESRRRKPGEESQEGHTNGVLVCLSALSHHCLNANSQMWLPSNLIHCSSQTAWTNPSPV